MGFCYFNNAAVAARAAQAAGARNVLIMDWDVHHGNGTQRIFYPDPSVMYMSTHRYDHGSFYPGSGGAPELGSGPGEGYTVNVPWNRPGVSDADMLTAFHYVVVPIAAEFRPDLVIVSAGFDAVAGDPLGGCRVSPSAFGHLTGMLQQLGPTVLLLEGGYNLKATAAATEACVRVLLGEAPTPLASTSGQAGSSSYVDEVSDAAAESIHEALRLQSRYWTSAKHSLAAFESVLVARQQQRQAERDASAAAAAAGCHVLHATSAGSAGLPLPWGSAAGGVGMMMRESANGMDLSEDYVVGLVSGPMHGVGEDLMLVDGPGSMNMPSGISPRLLAGQQDGPQEGLAGGGRHAG